MEFIREIKMIKDEESLCESRLYQLTEEYNAAFQYVCQIITAEISTWSIHSRQELQSATIYLTFICKENQGIVLPPSIVVRNLRSVDIPSTKLLEDFLIDINWQKAPYRKNKKTE